VLDTLAPPTPPPLNTPLTPSFAVVIPAYNEESGIEACVRAVSEALEALPNRTLVLVVDDGSRDGTPERLAALDATLERLTVVRHPVNSGYGAGIRTGIAEAQRRGFDYVLFMDSDLTNDPRYLAEFARRMGEGADVIKGSRYVSGGGTQGVPIWRSTVSRVGNAAARLLFGLPVRDCTNGFRAVRTDLLASVELHEHGFAVIMEELHRLRPLARDYAEVPIVLGTRAAHQTRSSFAFTPSALAQYLKYPVLSALDRLKAGG
jgi:dolichol-phosphate mannosyltransferase